MPFTPMTLENETAEEKRMRNKQQTIEDLANILTGVAFVAIAFYDASSYLFGKAKAAWEAGYAAYQAHQSEDDELFIDSLAPDSLSSEDELTEDAFENDFNPFEEELDDNLMFDDYQEIPNFCEDGGCSTQFDIWADPVIEDKPALIKPEIQKPILKAKQSAAETLTDLNLAVAYLRVYPQSKPSQFQGAEKIQLEN